MTRKLCPHGHGTFDVSADLCPACGAPLLLDQAAQVIAQRYRLDRLIGLGGTRSAVWEGYDLRTTRQVAVKVLTGPSGVEIMRFTRGAYLFAELDHPNVAKVYEYGEYSDDDGGGLYLVMERLTGATLDRIARRGPLPFARACALTEQLLDGLSEVHAHRAVHRDIKPGNVFVTPDDIDGSWRARLFDFDLAMRVEDVTTMELYGDALLPTASGAISGTPEYMAPEQILGHPLDARTDVYAVGITLFRLLSGRRPFTATDRQQIYRAHLQEPLPPLPPSAHGTPWPPGLDEVLTRATAKRRGDRFSSAFAFRDALRDLRRPAIAASA